MIVWFHVSNPKNWTYWTLQWRGEFDSLKKLRGVWVQQPPGDSKWPFHPLVGGHLTISKGHLTIPKRSQRIARHWKTNPQKLILLPLQPGIFVDTAPSAAAKPCAAAVGHDASTRASDPLIFFWGTWSGYRLKRRWRKPEINTISTQTCIHASVSQD